jgi:hypothetical protein
MLGNAIGSKEVLSYAMVFPGVDFVRKTCSN